MILEELLSLTLSLVILTGLIVRYHSENPVSLLVVIFVYVRLHFTRKMVCVQQQRDPLQYNTNIFFRQFTHYINLSKTSFTKPKNFYKPSTVFYSKLIDF